MNFSKIGAILSNFIIFKLFPPTKWIIKKWMKNAKNCTFTPKMNYLKWYNIYAENAHFGWTFFQDCGKIEIWEGTVFGYENMILTQWYKNTEWLLTDYYIKDVKIGKKCWITSRCIILGGVTIWDNVIIGAWSVVTKDIPSDCFAAWNPAKIIKMLK